MIHSNDVHVHQDKSETWLVSGHGRRSELARYAVREYAMAFGRAVAYGRRGEMLVYEIDGSIVRHPRSSLTYPILLP